MTPKFRSGRRWRATVQAALRRSGYQLVRYAPGVSLYEDIRVRLDSVTEPIVFDIGANEGQSIEQFRQAIPAAEIYAFEPSASTFAKLCARTSNYPNVHLVNSGVGAVSGLSTLLENEDSQTSSFLRPLETWWGEVVAETEVELVALDDFCAAREIQRIDLLKTDTQGFELEVLKGASRLMMSREVRLVLLEVIFADLYEGIPPFDVVFGFLRENGFELVGFYNSVVRDHRLAWSDALFALRSQRERR